jgi:hypothetical protein
MRTARISLREAALWCFLAAWGLFLAAVVVPIITAALQRHGMIDQPADLLWGAVSSLTRLTARWWFPWFAGGCLGLVTGFAAGVWLDALMKRREDAPPRSANISENTEKDRQTLALEAHTAELRRANELRRQESDPAWMALRKRAEQQATKMLESAASTEKNFTSRTAAELLDYYRHGLTPLQAGKLVQPHIGLWIKVEGVALMILDGGGDIAVVLKNGSDTYSCRFEKKWEPTLMRFSNGDHMSVVGKIGPSQNGQQFYLINCELPS